MDHLSEQYRVKAIEFAKAFGRSSYLESIRTGTLARLIKHHQDTSNEKISHSAAESAAKASEEWFIFNQELAEAKEQTEILRAKKKYIEFMHWEAQNADANKRSEMKL